MTLRLNGSTSGYVELDAPAVAGTTAITLPATSGTVALTASPTFTGTVELPSTTTLGGSTLNLPGLVKITDSTFSAQSTVSINNCFTSTYLNYRIVVETVLASGSQNIRFRMRVSGSDNSTANAYASQRLTADGFNNVSSERFVDSYGVLSATTTTATHLAVVDFTRPATANATGFVSLGNDPQTGGRVSIYAGTHNQTVAYDGITIYPASSTITGSIKIYGYRD
jgi:hypothetical protein